MNMPTFPPCPVCGVACIQEPRSVFCSFACEQLYHGQHTAPLLRERELGTDHMDDMMGDSTMYDEAETFYPELEDTQ